MKQSIIILTSILLLTNNAFALVASDIDMSPAVVDTSLIVTSILSFLVLIMGYKKVLTLLGR